jgi:hypothetical protein
VKSSGCFHYLPLLQTPILTLYLYAHDRGVAGIEGIARVPKVEGMKRLTRKKGLTALRTSRHQSQASVSCFPAWHARCNARGPVSQVLTAGMPGRSGLTEEPHASCNSSIVNHASNSFSVSSSDRFAGSGISWSNSRCLLAICRLWQPIGRECRECGEGRRETLPPTHISCTSTFSQTLRVPLWRGCLRLSLVHFVLSLLTAELPPYSHKYLLLPSERSHPGQVLDR